ncbi:hypothetical protein [Caldilinea sp.]|uniref:hypothetical protein n=1 Tax=Caldilinea sp. TaxID=2293560 RepID=UPI002C864DA8|nr:hypothetical protein [Caldilinea sp.]HRA66999.1 hypothetical protein [Caldilinea sp.]
MTNYMTLSNDELLACIEIAGITLSPELLRVLLARRLELRESILERFTASIDDDWDDSDDPRWYRAVHYGFLLIAYRERKALPIFAAIYMNTESYENLIEWFEEEPAHFGPAAIPVFQAVVDAAPGLEWDFGAAMSVSILSAIAMRFPQTRQEIVSFLRSHLPPLHMNGNLTPDNDDEIDELWASIVDALAELRDFDSKQQVLAMFDADLIDPTEIDRESYLDALTEPPSSEKKPPFDIFAMYARVAKFNTPKDV